MTNEPQTPQQIIDLLGGTSAVARMTERSAQAVSNWRSRGLPSDVFLIMADALKAKGIEADPSLWGILQPPRATQTTEFADAVTSP
ncbi:MAG: hypothetical protein ACK53Z_02875 [Betaproteobacteria bacterium]|jgi:hypothetical protein